MQHLIQRNAEINVLSSPRRPAGHPKHVQSVASILQNIIIVTVNPGTATHVAGLRKQHRIQAA